MRGLALALMLCPLAQAQWIAEPERVEPHVFAIMAWGGSPSDPEQLRLLKEAGLNITGFCRVPDLEKVRPAGLWCFLSDKRANGYDWEKLPPESEIRRNVQELAGEIGDNPAVLGFYLGDEPHARS